MKHIDLGKIIEPAKARRAGNIDYPVLSMTMRDGLVNQADKFKKRIASADTSPYKVVERNQLVVSFPIDEGVLAFQNLYDEAIVSPAYNIWNLQEDASVDSRYLEKYLRSPRALAFYKSKLRSTTARRRSIPNDDFLSLPVPLPPLLEQKRILKLLDEADDLRKLRTQADRRATALIPALFHKMFGDLKNESWQEVKLGAVAEIKSGAGFPLEKQGILDQPIPFFKVGDMNTPGNESEMLKFQHSISEATRKELGATLLPAGSVIFPKVGAAIGTNKKRTLIRPSCVDNNVMAILPGEKILSKYILALLAAKDLMEFASDSNPPSIRKTVVEDWQIPLPPLELQNEFAERAAEIRELEASQATSRTRLDALFQSMLHRAFNGEL